MLSDKEHNKTSGSSIDLKIEHPDLKFVSRNYFEGNASGLKTTDNPGFSSHIDGLNSNNNTAYRYTVVMSKVVGNEKIGYTYPYSICYNRRGCKTRRGYLANIQTYSECLWDYIENVPKEDWEVNSSLIFSSNHINYLASQSSTLKITERWGTLILNRTPHANKHVRLSSYANVILDAEEKCSWWKCNHTVELMSFMGLSCTPISTWYAMDSLKQDYLHKASDENIAIKLNDYCKLHQGGLDCTCGH
eukprot:4145669-Ditylum_brightwellii.AAC.1